MENIRVYCFFHFIGSPELSDSPKPFCVFFIRLIVNIHECFVYNLVIRPIKWNALDYIHCVSQCISFNLKFPLVVSP